MGKIVFAVAAHPDDIEFMMSGTLFRLKTAGCELHYMNLCNGDCGTAVHDKLTIARMRREEGMAAAAYLGAQFHESLTSDLEIFYDLPTLARMTAVMREVHPDLLLVQYPDDYMEDHCNAVRLAVSAAFNRGMINAPCEPARPPFNHPVTVYHALPHGLRTPLDRPVVPGCFVDVSGVIDRKREMLSKHRSQKEWLDLSQGMDAYVNEMAEEAAAVGRMSGTFAYAEGWTRHNPLGFCGRNDDPLNELLDDKIRRNPDRQETGSTIGG